jgi:hypothetical protein
MDHSNARVQQRGACQDEALLRMVDNELSGMYREPEAAAVLRTGGDPKAGVCTLSSGQTVQVY